MKTMFVVSERRVNEHVGEEYDVIVEVVHEPTTENIQLYANQITAGIKDLWNSQENDPGREVVVHLDAAGPFAAMLLNLQIILRNRDGIVISLPWDKPIEVDKLDAESKEVLHKLENK